MVNSILTKKCRGCGVIKPITDFVLYYHNQKDKSYRHYYCRDCQRKRNREYMRLRETGWTAEQYQEALKNQNNLCDICGQPETAKTKGTLRQLCADHNHKTSKKRGLICNNCNHLLGLAKDNPDILINAAAYLRKYDG